MASVSAKRQPSWPRSVGIHSNVLPTSSRRLPSVSLIPEALERAAIPMFSTSGASRHCKLAPTNYLKVPPVAWVLEGGEQDSEGTEDMEGGEHVEGAEHGEGIGRRGSRMAPVEGMGELRRMLKPC
eukprot:gene13187-biopygen7364